MNTVLVIRFNWPKFAGVLAIVLAAAAASVTGASWSARAVLWVAAGPAVAWAVTSVAATYWVYDHRHVYQRLADGLGELGDWAMVHAGFDDSAPALRASIGRPPVAVREVPASAGRSLRRARALTERRVLTERRALAPGAAGREAGGDLPGWLPLAADSADSLFLTFAAHEVRDVAEQRALFGELHTALRPGGRLVLTEHARDLANFAVYGPAVLHFQPLATWRTRAAEAGLCVESDTTITPFVHRIVCRR